MSQKSFIKSSLFIFFSICIEERERMNLIIFIKINIKSKTKLNDNLEKVNCNSKLV